MKLIKKINVPSVVSQSVFHQMSQVNTAAIRGMRLSILTLQAATWLLWNVEGIDC